MHDKANERTVRDMFVCALSFDTHNSKDAVSFTLGAEV